MTHQGLASVVFWVCLMGQSGVGWAQQKDVDNTSGSQDSPKQAPATTTQPPTGQGLGPAHVATRVKRMRPRAAARLLEVMGPAEGAAIFVHLDAQAGGRILSKMDPTLAHRMLLVLQATADATPSETP